MSLPSIPFRGVWISEALLGDGTLNGLEKLILAVVDHWDDGEGCSLTKRQLTEIVGTTYQTLVSCLERLVERGRLRKQDGGYRMHRGKKPLPVKVIPKPPRRVILPQTDHPEERALVDWFYGEQVKNFPRMVKAPTDSQVEAGVGVLRQLQRIDGYTFDEVSRTVRYGVADSFWGRNLLSPATLRQKCRNGATKFANIHQQLQEKSPRRRTTTPESTTTWTQPVVDAFVKLTRCSPSVKEILALEQVLMDQWEDLPGETTRPFIIPPTQNQSGRRSLKSLLKTREGLLPHMVEFIRVDMKNFSSASFGYITGTGFTKFRAFLERRLGHRLIDGTPLT